MKKRNYDFNVLINGNEVKEYGHEGATYIEGRKGSEYSLKFRNNTTNRVMISLSVDGLSVMTGKIADGKSDGYVISAWDSLIVPGWKIDNTKAAAFQFCPQGEKKNKSYIEELAKEGFDVDVENQGVIGCQVFEEFQKYSHYDRGYSINHYHHVNGIIDTPNYPVWMNGGNSISPCVGISMTSAMPTNMMSMVASASLDNSEIKGLGTAFGEDKTFKTTTVNFDAKATPETTFVIYYDTLLNLKKKGVIIEKKVPNPFPGSNPDGCYIPKSRR